MNQIINTIEDKAFELLPHIYAYDDNREIIGRVFWIDGIPDIPSYEEFMEQLDLYRELEDEKGILSLSRELERIEKGINLAVDISEFPEPDWLIEGLVVRNGLTLLYGDSGTGKTTFCLYLADAMKKGKNLFGLKCKQGSVLFVENDESGELLKSHRDKVGLPERLLVANTDIVWEADKKFNEEFEHLLYYYIPDVTVIDAYTSLGIPDITRPESALVLDELRRLAKQHHCAMVIVHHTNLRGEQMGSSLHRAKMDSMVSLATLEDKIMLTQEKIRGSKFDAKTIDFNQDTLQMKENTMTTKDVVFSLAGSHSDDEIMSMLPKAKKTTIKRYIREARSKANP